MERLAQIVALVILACVFALACGCAAPQAKIQDSTVHGDADTSILKAKAEVDTFGVKGEVTGNRLFANQKDVEKTLVNEVKGVKDSILKEQQETKQSVQAELKANRDAISTYGISGPTVCMMMGALFTLSCAETCLVVMMVCSLVQKFRPPNGVI